MSGNGSTVTDLFLEYLRAQEEHVAPDEASLLDRAGGRAGELRSRIALFESMQGLASRLRDSKTQVAERFGRFAVVELIAEGGMGTVFLARDPDLDRLVALKILHPLVLGSRSSREMILNEARSLARLEHPGVVRVLEVGHVEHRDHVVMEHVPGPSLARVVEELRRLRDPAREGGGENEGWPALSGKLARSLEAPLARIACLARIAEALAYCHRCGVVHRDVKPANVLFGEKGQPVLIDFGLAHLADAEGSVDVTQRLVGTPAYLAPEQVESGRTGRDPRSDQFSFGVLAYELLTLAQPFQRETRTATLDAVAAARPERPTHVAPELPRDAEAIVLHALAARPAERYPGMAELADDLRAVLEHRPISVAHPSLARRTWLWLRRNRLPVLAAAAGLALVLGTWLASSLASARERAAAVRERLAGVGVEELENPLQFAEAGRALEEMLLEARALEGSALRLVGEGPGAHVRRRVEAWSERYRAVLSGELARETAGEFQLPIAWSRVIDLERRIHPDVEDDEGFWQRGKVVLPDSLPEDLEVVLYAQVPVRIQTNPDDAFATFREVPLTEELVPGAYRLQAWRPGDGAPAYQLEFVVTNEWQAPLRLELVAPDPELGESLVEVPRLQRGKQTVPAFRISRRPVARGELMDFLAATDRPAPDTFELGADLDGPAWCDQATAVEYARWCGARLPTAVELDVAVEAGAIDLAEGTAGSHAEWVSDLPIGSGPKMASALQYDLFAHYEVQRGGFVHLVSCLRPLQRSAGARPVRGTTGICFRTALSNDERLGY